MTRRKPASKAKRIRQLRGRGKTYFEIAQEVGCTEQYVYKVLRAAGMVTPRKAG